MTLKQFLELAGGLLLAYLFFSSNLIFIFKWPLVIMSILFGAGLAFFPLEDRPLDQWITNFFKAIYAPTRFIWKKSNRIPHLFLFTTHTPDVVNTITKTIKAPTIQAPTAKTADLTDFEAEKVSSLDSLFKSLPPVPSALGQQAKIIDDKPITKPTISVRKLTPQSEIDQSLTKKDLHTPAPAPVAIPKPIPTKAEQAESLNKTIFAAHVAPTAPSKKNDAGSASSPRRILMPASPKDPDIVTGVVVTQNGALVDNAIVQIVSGDGIPQRAMKTNSLGQFYTSTPLSHGTYLLEVDKAGVTFSPQQITINGTVLSPFELKTN